MEAESRNMRDSLVGSAVEGSSGEMEEGERAEVRSGGGLGRVWWACHG